MYLSFLVYIFLSIACFISIVYFPIPFEFFCDGLFDCSCHSACLARSQNDGLEFKSSIYFFSSPESTNESRGHYQQAWPPIVHAAALWLNEEGFANAEKESDNLKKGDLLFQFRKQYIL